MSALVVQLPFIAALVLVPVTILLTCSEVDRNERLRLGEMIDC